MSKISAKIIYQQNDKLEEQLPLWPFMNREARNIFVEKLRDFIVAARQSEQITKSESTKTRLRNIITTWEELLNNISHTATSELTIISKFDKISQSPTEIRAEESSIEEFILSISSHLPSQILSPRKVDPNTPVSIPHDPELRAIVEELSSIVNAKRPPD